MRAFLGSLRIHIYMYEQDLIYDICDGACGAVVYVVENGHGDPISNPGLDYLHFT